MRFLFLLIVRLVILYAVFRVIRSVLESLFGGRKSQVSTNPKRPIPTVSSGGELKKDPVCGTYVSADVAVTKRINGQTVHFCSSACRDKYRAAS
jgi:YHS domain-containing protein